MARRPGDRREGAPSTVYEEVPVNPPSENFLVSEQLQKMPSVFSRGLIYVIVLLLAASLVYSLVGKIEIVVECRAVARSVSHEMRVLSDRTGYLESIFVQEGQEVAKDAPLFHIRSRERLKQRAEVDRINDRWSRPRPPRTPSATRRTASRWGSSPRRRAAVSSRTRTTSLPPSRRCWR